MESLLSLTFKALVGSRETPSIELLPLQLKEEYRRKEAQILCGTVVSDRIIAEETIQSDPWIGYTEGIHSTNQNKRHYVINALVREEYLKKGVYNVGAFLVPLMVYYLKQESWFRSEYIYPGPSPLVKYAYQV